MTVAHVTPILDIYAGAITGVNTSLGWNSPAYGDPGDNNNAPGFEGGFGLNLFDGKVAVIAATNIGPNNANTPLVAALCGILLPGAYPTTSPSPGRRPTQAHFVGEANYSA